ncbi:phosphoglycerate mutase family protein [Brachyspira innocens]|uniref:Phosphoglycerate mutase family protein n=1 Tax=Brachyspira innocens TaxID=13264 RepID=A0ABT8Z1X9_9SPIR|nr:phosphoglycerate mutase family protein [Brachyspira innocens]MDO6994212.1 phosphoglycerate mutase family protein [Brachyspira innocens]MDO7021632.1 phosphoglycerate mutase family protein [Brachyspira innocens]
MNNNIIDISLNNQKKAFSIIKELDIENAFKSIGARVNLVGSLKMGLLMKNKDIDFHVYTSSLNIEKSFLAVSKIAKNKKIDKLTYTNLIDTDEHCIEWHLFYRDDYNADNIEIWQIDIIHILEGSYYDGYFEKAADDVMNMLTQEKRNIILQLKYETPDNIKIMGIEYYKAVLKDNIQTYEEFIKWRDKQLFNGIIEF